MARDRYLSLEERLYPGHDNLVEWTKEGKIDRRALPDLWVGVTPFYPKMRLSTFKEFGRILDQAMSESIKHAKENPPISVEEELGPILPGEPGYVEPNLLDRLIEEERAYYRPHRRFMRLFGFESPTRNISE